jgi:DNA-binding transcriptional MocR family regulator
VERRRRILDIADKHAITVVEDDVYGGLYGSGVPTLYELSGGRTIYINSLSKCIAPGLRMGFLAASSSRLPQLAQPIYNTTWCSPGIMGEIFTNWMDRGVIKSMLHWHRREIHKRQLMAYSIFKGSDYQVSPGCYHMWLKLPRHITVEQVVVNARNVGLLLTHSTAFSITGDPVPNALRLSLGRPASIRSLKHALKQLAELLNGQTVGHPLVI